MSAPIVLHTSRKLFPLTLVVTDGIVDDWVVDGDRAGVPRRTARGQLWERVVITTQWNRPPRARTAPVSKLYCEQCDYDDHYCGGCGEPLAHGQNCWVDHD